jgi:Stress responsive A/B Barrel Domain
MPRVKHVVLLRFKPETPADALTELFSALNELRHKVPGLLDVSAGVNSSPERLARGFTHGFVMTFADESSRDGYLPHPAHEAVKAQLLRWIDGGAAGVVVMDWLE